MPGQKDEERYADAAMGIDPLGDDDEVLARTLYSSGNQPLAPVDVDPLRKRSPEREATKAKPTATQTEPQAAPRQQPTKAARPQRRVRRAPQEAQHYKVLSISLYNDDIERMDELVKELKKRGFTRMNRSALIRFALDNVDISKMPRGY